MRSIRMNKRGWIFNLFLVVATLATFIGLAMIFVSETNVFPVGIGEKQAEMINLTLKAELSMIYLDKAVELAYINSYKNLTLGGGFSGVSECGKYQEYNLWNCPDLRMPDSTVISEEFVNVFQDELDGIISHYPYDVFTSRNHMISFDPDSGRIFGAAKNAAVFMSGSLDVPGNAEPAADPVHTGWDADDGGDFFARLAADYERKYSSLPYVWGGVSPYKYEIAVNDKNTNPDSIYKDIMLPKTVPEGSQMSGMPVVPGFDCSGFVWFTLKHMGVDVGRLTAQGFYDWAKKNGAMVCDKNLGKACAPRLLEENGEPGDLIFIDQCREDRVCHIGIFSKEGGIIESAGGTGLVKRPIPDKYNNMIVAVYRIDFEKIKKTDVEVPENTIVHSDGNGHMTGDEPISYTAASYLVQPSFKADFDYDFSFVKSIREQAIYLVDKARSCTYEGCISAALDFLRKDDDKSYYWSDDCDEGEEKLIYSLDDILGRLYETEDDDCFYEIEVPDDLPGVESEIFIRRNLDSYPHIITTRTRDVPDEFNLALRDDKKFTRNILSWDEMKQMFGSMRCLQRIPDKYSDEYSIFLFSSRIDDTPIYWLYYDDPSKRMLHVLISQSDGGRYSYNDITDPGKSSGVIGNAVGSRFLIMQLACDGLFCSPLRMDSKAISEKCIADDKCLDESVYEKIRQAVSGCKEDIVETPLYFMDESGRVTESVDDVALGFQYATEGLDNMWMEINGNKFRMDGSLFFFKKDKKMGLMSDDTFRKIRDSYNEKQEEMPFCRPAGKTKFRFCIYQDRVLPDGDPVRYNIALMLGSVP